MWPKRIARVCLNMLRSRSLRGEESPGVHLPDPLVSPDAELQPEGGGVPSDSAGLALLAVLDTLAPAERLAFVLHDMFELSPSAAAPGLPFTASIGIQAGCGQVLCLSLRSHRRPSGQRATLAGPRAGQQGAGLGHRGCGW